MQVSDYFGQGGLLAASLPHFEARDGQLKMAQEVCDALSVQPSPYSGAEILLIEAETGIGKTLAYLLPAILSRRKIVISTATITLQDQILKKEIPLLKRILKDDFPVVCVKGRQNYLCLYRWHQYQSSRQMALIEDETCNTIEEWVKQTETGDRAELSWLRDGSPLWPKISAQSHQCLGGECPEASYCYINELRRQAGAARLLVVNHHLFFSDLAIRKSGFGEVLPRYEGVIFDEAHHLENIASTFFGKQFSHYQVMDLVSDVERQAESDLPPSIADRMVSSARGLRQRAEQFMALFPEERGRFPLLDFIEKFPGWYEEVNILSSGLERLASECGAYQEYGEGWKTLLKRAEELQNNLVEIGLPELLSDDGCDVHWYERRDKSVAILSTPVNISENLKAFLYPNVSYCIFTSATLTTGGDFSYVRDRLGITDEAQVLKLDSPFSYTERTCLYIPPDGFPDPTHRDYSQKLCVHVEEMLKLSRGRALVLCTSFKGMEMIADYLENRVDYPLLVQGQASRHALLRRFSEDVESVLVAVASFWEGVDVPGEALSCVIIDKLPFEAPNDPVLQARMVRVRDAGGNPFFDIQVPRAILSLRQGVGRLMRSSADSGVIAIMDSRLYGKGYGKLFLNSLPPSPVVRDLNSVGQFFERCKRENGVLCR